MSKRINLEDAYPVTCQQALGCLVTGFHFYVRVPDFNSDNENSKLYKRVQSIKRGAKYYVEKADYIKQEYSKKPYCLNKEI